MAAGIGWFLVDVGVGAGEIEARGLYRRSRPDLDRAAPGMTKGEPEGPPLSMHD
jgi:hypothetical protein